jgi:hypothetical protein
LTEYLDVAHGTLRQGDIVLCPTAVILEGVGGGMETPRAPAVLGDTVVGWLWDEPPDPVPHASYEARWSPGLVLSHDCELEKEFNERVIELISGGMPEEAAIEEASGDPTLDPFAVVAPLLPYTVFAERQFEGIRTGQRIGVVPIDQLPGDGGDYVVDLFRPCVVSVMLLAQDMKVASMAPASVYELRYKLTEAYATRDLAVLTELEALVGNTITGVEAIPKGKKKTGLILHLEDAESVHLEIRRPRGSLAAEIVRQPRKG